MASSISGNVEETTKQIESKADNLLDREPAITGDIEEQTSSTVATENISQAATSCNVISDNLSGQINLCTEDYSKELSLNPLKELQNDDIHLHVTDFSNTPNIYSKDRENNVQRNLDKCTINDDLLGHSVDETVDSNLCDSNCQEHRLSSCVVDSSELSEIKDLNKGEINNSVRGIYQEQKFSTTLFVPNDDENNSSSVGFEYSENTESANSFHPRHFGDDSHSALKKHHCDKETNQLQDSKEQNNHATNIPKHELLLSITTEPPSNTTDKLSLCGKESESVVCSGNQQGSHTVDKEQFIITDNLTSDKTVQSLCSKRKSPSVQDRRLKLDALVENIKSLKAAETKETPLDAIGKNTKINLDCALLVQTELNKKNQIYANSQANKDRFDTADNKKVHTCESDGLKIVRSGIKNVENEIKSLNLKSEVLQKFSSDISTVKIVINENTGTIKTELNDHDEATNDIRDHTEYALDRTKENWQCANSTCSHESNAENEGHTQVGEINCKKYLQPFQENTLKVEKSCLPDEKFEEKQVESSFDGLEKSNSGFLKPPVFQFDSRKDKKVYQFTNVIGNKLPVVYLGERVSKNKVPGQGETNKLTKLANVKPKKPVKKIEMIRHPTRRIRRVASLNALAMVNILFGKDEPQPKVQKSNETKDMCKKVISSKSLSKAKMILEAKVKCLLKKAKTSKDKELDEDNSLIKVKKEKTTPKKISQIEQSLAKLSLDPPPGTISPSKSSIKSSEKSPKKVSTPPKSTKESSPQKSPSKSTTKVSVTSKSPTKTSSEKISDKKVKTKVKNNEDVKNKKTKKKHNEIPPKGEKSKKSAETIQKKKVKEANNCNSDKNKVTKQRRKKGELLRSARTHSFPKTKVTQVETFNVDKNKEHSSYKCVHCQQQSSRKNNDNTIRHEEKNSFVDGSMQYNMGHVDSGTYSTHSYSVVQNMTGTCVHCSQNGGLYSSQGPLGQSSGFIGGIIGQPAGLVGPCQTFTIGSVPMVQYHPFGAGYPIQYQSHNTLPHCGCPSCYYYTPTASPLPHHDTCHHSMPPSYSAIRDDAGGIPRSYISKHEDVDPEIDVVGGLSPHHTPDHHFPFLNRDDQDVEIDVVGGVPPLAFNSSATLNPSKKKKKKSPDSETKKKLEKDTILKSDKENKEKCVKKKKDSEEKKTEKKTKKKLELKKHDEKRKSTDELKTATKKSKLSEDVKLVKAKTLSQLAAELKAKKNALSTGKDKESTPKKTAVNKSTENVKAVKKRPFSKSVDESQSAKKRKLTKSEVECNLESTKTNEAKRKSMEEVFIDDTNSNAEKQSKTSKIDSNEKTAEKVFNRSKSVDLKLLKENEISKSYPKRKRVASLTRQISAEVPKRISPSGKQTTAPIQDEKKTEEIKKPKKRNHSWEFNCPPEKKKIMVSGSLVEKECYPAIVHTDGDIIYVRDVVILRSGPRKSDIPYLGKVTAFWEENGEMMMSLLWYYHPEHTDTGRLSHHLPVEIFASKHRDENSVACIDDKGYVLTYNEYCRYRAEKRRVESNLPPRPMVVPILEDNPRAQRIPPPDVDSNTVYMCRQVYDFKLKRILKNPS